jgi:hypothetical protein
MGSMQSSQGAFYGMEAVFNLYMSSRVCTQDNTLFRYRRKLYWMFAPTLKNVLVLHELAYCTW